MNPRTIAYTLTAAIFVSMCAAQGLAAPQARADELCPKGTHLERRNAGNYDPADDPFAGSPHCVADPVAAAPQPSLAVDWKPWPGGITATVRMADNPTDGPVKCVYSTQGLETFDRAFTLAGDSPSDVVIAPTVPLNRYWPVTVSCDNGVRLDTGSVY